MCVIFRPLPISKDSLDRVQESPTLDLARDYSRFVIAFFDVIATSAPHIYHSALPLSPRSSMVREKFEKCARPLARVVHGLPVLWEPVVATVCSEGFGGTVVWSPCNRFIAVAKSAVVEIRDAATLILLSTFEFPPGHGVLSLSFSPDSRFLTQFNREDLVTWDLQTGGSAGTISPEGLLAEHSDFSSTYSMGGEVLAVVYLDESREKTFVATHDLSTRRTHLHRVSEGRILSPIWTQGEFLRFATLKSGHITIWQAEFTSTHTPQVVESLPAPGEIADAAFERSQFLPTLSRLAVALEDALLVWDARDSKILLKASPFPSTRMSFSSDGRFFAHTSTGGQVHVWKESPAGDYTLHQTLAFSASREYTVPLLSPDGQSIVICLLSTIHLWHTRDPILSSGPTPVSDQRDFILGFSPNEDEASAAFGRYGRNVVTILDLQSGDPQRTIDMGVKVEGLGMAGSAIVVVGEGKIATWNLVAGNSSADTEDKVRITRFDLSPPSRGQAFSHMSISPDLSHIVTLGRGTKLWSTDLEIYDTSTGRCLANTTVQDVHMLGSWFTPDGYQVWGVDFVSSSANGWGITGDSKSGVQLQPIGATTCPTGVLPWRSSRGHEITFDGWVLSPTQKRLLWLPHSWRLDDGFRTWGGRFLGLRHRGLPEVVVLEFFE